MSKTFSPKSTRTKTKASAHRFTHFCNSGNVVTLELTVPCPGDATQFNLRWDGPIRRGDRRERKRWLASVADSVSKIAGRKMFVRLLPDRETK
jgi:hypothetical protein